MLQVAVPLRGCGLGRAAGNRGRARQDDDSRFRVALGDAVVNTILVIAPVAGERSHRARDLIGKGPT